MNYVGRSKLASHVLLPRLNPKIHLVAPSTPWKSWKFDQQEAEKGRKTITQTTVRA